jgi:hypothetical protein
MLKEHLLQRSRHIASKWLEAVLASYPASTGRFMATEKDPFINPVGSALTDGLGEMVAHVLEGSVRDARPCLDRLIRIRAVQGFSASQAVGFVFLLKELLRSEAEVTPIGPVRDEELRTLWSRVDDLALQAFDIYVACREKLAEIKVNEVRMQTARLLERRAPAHPAKEAP